MNHEASGSRIEKLTEQRKLESIVSKYKDSCGCFDIVAVPGHGYIMQSRENIPAAQGNWLLLDFDDTLVATSEAKKIRLGKFKEYLKKNNSILNDKDAERIMNLTDGFSRWRDGDKESVSYHPKAHLTALQWVVDNLEETTAENIDDKLILVEERLKMDKEQIGRENLPDMPFYFNGTDVVWRNVDSKWSEDLEKVFTESIVRIPEFKDMIKTAIEMNETVNLGIFTYGDPDFQLIKVLELMKANPSLRFSQIWLTTNKSKGEFIKEIVRTNIISKFKVDTEFADEYSSRENEDRGQILGGSEHLIIIFDDDPAQLDSIVQSTNEIKDLTRAEIIAVRSKREGTKTYKMKWEVKTPYGEIDYSSKKLSAKDISNIFLRYIYKRSGVKIGNNVI